ncbi:AraC family transcriptional regulator [Salinispirillum sp. LH 10-3-1]|uniref:AraC family transcriptional regulator n=1 Tax=Salinispirillum sp. LH 10-3-1 TaxID=2952525 RepID=A0AB38YF06_9GAMM
MTTETQLQQLSSDGHAHHHAHHQLVFGLQGRAEFDLEGEGGKDVTPWTGCLVPSEYNHAFQGVGANRMLIVNIDPQPSAMSFIHPQVIDQLFDRPRYIELDLGFVRMLRAMGEEIAQHPGDPWLAGHVTGTLVHGLFHRMAETNSLRNEPSRRIQLARLDAWLHQRLSDPVRVADMAALCCLSVSQFQQSFRQLTGKTPYQYVLHVRLNTAIWLLQHTHQPIADIALQVGFANQSALTKAMRNVHGRVPTHFRRIGLH